MQNSAILASKLDELLSVPAGQKIKQIMDVIAAAQKGLYSLMDSEDSSQFSILKIGTVLQIFLIDTLASGKRADELTDEDWKNIVGKVYQYAVIGDGQAYSEFVFSLYADYIVLSAELMRGNITEAHLEGILALADIIRHQSDLLKAGEISEATYIESCLWTSLEAMVKLLSSLFDLLPASEFAELIQSASQFAFEYGRYVLYAREQEILQRYIDHQHMLDEELKSDYESFLAEVQAQAERFQGLLASAFSPDVHQALIQSAALAREAGVDESELLTTVEDIDDFFM